MKTIEQKLNSLIPQEFGGEMNPELLEGCVKIAEEFAIGFAEWQSDYDYDGFLSSKELLEIYKKENQL